MTDKPDNTTPNNPLPTDVLEQFPLSERNHVKKLWNETAHADIDLPEVTDEDAEYALASVHTRTGKKGVTVSPFLKSYGWYIAAAAVLLLVFGGAFLMMPKTVNVSYGEVVTVDLPDGSQAELNSGSHISYNRLFSRTNRNISLDGEAFFTVSQGSRAFTVETSNSVVRVTGTQFNVRSWSEEPEGETEVLVSEGSVEFYSAGDPDNAVTLSAGEYSRLGIRMDRPTEPEQAPMNRVLGWREQMLVFNEKPLEVIFRELERRFAVTIELEDEAAARETLTTHYVRPKDAGTVLEDICRVKGLRFSETATGYRVYK